MIELVQSLGSAGWFDLRAMFVFGSCAAWVSYGKSGDRHLIMVPGLEKVYPLFTHQINQPVLLGYATRPCSRRQVLQSFRVANAIEWIAKDVLNELNDSECGFSIVLYPVLQVFNKLGLKDGFGILTRQGRPRPGAHQPSSFVPHLSALWRVLQVNVLHLPAIEAGALFR